MRKIEKYILKKIASPFFFCMILISTIYIVVDLSTKLEHIIKGHIPSIYVVEYYLYYLPKILSELMPLCLLVAVIYSLTKMNKFNEIIAMRASGMSPFTIFKPYFAAALLLLALMFWSQEKLIPLIYPKFTQLEALIEGKEKGRVLKDVTFYAEGNRIIYAREFYPQEKTLNYLIILEQGLDKKILYKVTAETAQYKGGKWILYNLVIYKLKPDGTTIEEAIALSRKEYDLEESPNELLKMEMEMHYQPIRSLLKKLLTFKGLSDEVSRRIAVELYHKLSFPFTSVVLLLLGIYVGLKSYQVSFLKGLANALLIGFSYYCLDAFSYSLGKIGFLPPPLAGSFANISFLMIGLIMMGVILKGFK